MTGGWTAEFPFFCFGLCCRPLALWRPVKTCTEERKRFRNPPAWCRWVHYGVGDFSSFKTPLSNCTKEVQLRGRTVVKFFYPFKLFLLPLKFVYFIFFPCCTILCIWVTSLHAPTCTGTQGGHIFISLLCCHTQMPLLIWFWHGDVSPCAESLWPLDVSEQTPTRHAWLSPPSLPSFLPTFSTCSNFRCVRYEDGLCRIFLSLFCRISSKSVWYMSNACWRESLLSVTRALPASLCIILYHLLNSLL